MSTNRLEAFSDGVIAVAITLLVLNIHVPAAQQPGSLAHKLAAEWPSYVAYLVSFVTIGIIWINHHAMISRLRLADHSILMLNLLLLLTIAVLPFATDLLATYLAHESGYGLAATVYSGLFLLMALAFANLNFHILIRKADMLSARLPLAERRRILLRSVSGIVPYVVATAVAPFSAYATLAICGALAAFYATPLASGGEQTA